MIAAAVRPAPVGNIIEERSVTDGARRRALGTERAHERSIPLATRRALATLLDWQLWYWGQDIHHPQGNALLAYGFDRVRGPSDGTQRSTAYTLQPTQTVPRTLHGLSVLTVWGFALCATHAPDVADGSLVLVRHECSLGLCTSPLPAKAGTRDELPKCAFPETLHQWHAARRILASVARCAIDYETWAEHTLGAVHRADAYNRRPRAVRRRHSQPAFLTDAWRRFTDDHDSCALAPIR